jgi:hypothetical protein
MWLRMMRLYVYDRLFLVSWRHRRCNTEGSAEAFVRDSSERRLVAVYADCLLINKYTRGSTRVNACWISVLRQFDFRWIGKDVRGFTKATAYSEDQLREIFWIWADFWHDDLQGGSECEPNFGGGADCSQRSSNGCPPVMCPTIIVRRRIKVHGYRNQWQYIKIITIEYVVPRTFILRGALFPVTQVF